MYEFESTAIAHKVVRAVEKQNLMSSDVFHAICELELVFGEILKAIFSIVLFFSKFHRTPAWVFSCKLAA